MLNLVRRGFERGWVFLLTVALVLAGFELVLCAVVASMDVAGALGQMTQFAPPALREMIELNMPGGSPAAVVAFGWNHPVAHALLAAVAITLAARAVAGEVENGGIELALAQPVSRPRYFTAHLVFGMTALAAVLAIGIIGTVVGQYVWSLEPFGLPKLAALFLNALLLQLAIYALTLLVSAFGREAGRVALAGVLIAVISFLVNVVATLWSKAAFARPISLHAYFEPRDILVRGELAPSSLIVLATVTAIGIVAAYVVFAKRDLP
jgi:ABC-type transport system involved in multi-copper enzyme maturation permease subunit